MRLFPHPVQFDWDQGNASKNIAKHKIKNEGAEEVFVNQPIVLVKDRRHSQKEQRLMILGKTDKKRLLSVIFTLRDKKIRIVSARPMSRKERRLNEQKTQKYTSL